MNSYLALEGVGNNLSGDMQVLPNSYEFPVVTLPFSAIFVLCRKIFNNQICLPQVGDTLIREVPVVVAPRELLNNISAGLQGLKNID
jgi:hypothetical protein